MDDSGDFLTFLLTRSRLVQCSLILLALMFLWTLVDILERTVRYGAAKWQSRSFLKASAGLIEMGDWASIRTIAQTRTRSHEAKVVLNAVREFQKGNGCISAEQCLGFARRGAQLAANRVHEEWRRGLSSLDAIATTAPFVGLFGTAIGILDALSRGYVGSKSAYTAFIATNLAEALVPTAAGLLVGVFAMWCFNWRSDKLAVFDAEMKVASLELIKYLESQHQL